MGVQYGDDDSSHKNKEDCHNMFVSQFNTSSVCRMFMHRMRQQKMLERQVFMGVEECLWGLNSVSDMEDHVRGHQESQYWKMKGTWQQLFDDLAYCYQSAFDIFFYAAFVSWPN